MLAQISPGELTLSHQQLEGMDNCTKCHTIGKALSNDNCLSCHKEIQTRISQKKGFHAPLKDKQCVECHKEHHGRNFVMVRFDTKAFNHAQVGFSLEGKHATLKCEQCHNKNKIVAKDVVPFSANRMSPIYLGLSPECLACHKDEHRGQFKKECLQCHTMNGWKPAVKFLHDNAQFKLIGAHTKVQCGQCHKKTWENGATTQFIHLEFGSCKSCHQDPHKGKFKQKCEQCHTPESWHQLKTAQFNHGATQFPLKGKHANLKCEQCHQKNAKLKNASGELGFHITKFQKCSQCHADAHAKQFAKRKDGGMCESCHNEQGFSPSLFSLTDHEKNRFTLTGAHGAIPCAKCHVDGKVSAKSTKIFQWNENITCLTCHKDIHAGQFAKKMTSGCETCHTTEAWQTLKFSHDKTAFPLKGKHQTIQCAQCHKQKNNVVQYVGLATQCNVCHEDQHNKQFETNNGTQCQRCHVEDGWKKLLFDHNTQAKFALTGKHSNVACEKCHKEKIVQQKKVIQYKPLGTACIDCHPAG
ncbi:MAG: cytochrome c3 family protein [Bacteroidota bacterium]|nr:cytochrome c3 family protein [Bacteroidota bacterium]